MDSKIIADSCCDMTPQLRERLGVTSVPLTMLLGEKEFVDDELLDVAGFVAEMKACTAKNGSAAPSPHKYQQAIEEARDAYVITLSSKLSGSYDSAVLGAKLAEESGKGVAHVFDSKSASAGEILIAVKIRELLQAAMPKEQLIQTVNKFIESMKTYFILDRYDNLLKNGRLGKIKGRLINILNIKLVMGSDGNGSIALYAKVRGVSQKIEKMLSLIYSSGKKTDGENLVITHCNNESLAHKLSAAIKRQFQFKEILVVETRGLSSLYADDMGIIMAF